MAVVLVEVTLHQLAVAVVEFHLGVVAGVVVFVDALLGHGAVGGKALLFDKAVVLIARGLFLGHVVAHKDGALDAVAVLIVEIGGAAGELLGAVVLVPTQGIAVDVEVIGIPGVFAVLGAVFVLEIAAFVESDGIDTDELTATVAATVDVVGVFYHIDGISVDAHLLTGRFAGFITGKSTASDQQYQR